MGYFSNGTEGYAYWETYCSRCVHDKHEDCQVWAAHLLCNYEECNNPDSILQMLIPRAKDGGNEQCKMFIASKAELAKEEGA